MTDRVSAIYSTEVFPPDFGPRAEAVRPEEVNAVALETPPGAVAGTMVHRDHNQPWTNRNVRRS